MFNFASRFKLWIKLIIQNKQTRMVVARTSHQEHHWNYKHKETRKSWNYWKYSMILLPSALKLQTVGYEDHFGDNIKFNKMYQMKTFNREKKLKFVNVASIQAMNSILEWLNIIANVHTRAESKNSNDDKESNKKYVRLYS